MASLASGETEGRPLKPLGRQCDGPNGLVRDEKKSSVDLLKQGRRFTCPV